MERELESGERNADERVMKREEDASALESEADDSPHVTHQDHARMALLMNLSLPQSIAQHAGAAFRRTAWQEIVICCKGKRRERWTRMSPFRDAAHIWGTGRFGKKPKISSVGALVSSDRTCLGLGLGASLFAVSSE